MKPIVPVLSALVALAACDGGTQSAQTTTEEAEAAGNIVGNSSSSKPAVEAGADAPAPTAIPAAIQGRWGLVPADCEPGRDDAKGLLTIGADKLDFYESTGTLDTISEAAPTRIRAAFDFTGEGMTWQREVVLDVQDDGATLIRREYGQDAAPGPFRYARCQQGR